MHTEYTDMLTKHRNTHTYTLSSALSSCPPNTNTHANTHTHTHRASLAWACLTLLPHPSHTQSREIAPSCVAEPTVVCHAGPVIRLAPLPHTSRCISTGQPAQGSSSPCPPVGWASGWSSQSGEAYLWAAACGPASQATCPSA